MSPPYRGVTAAEGPDPGATTGRLRLYPVWMGLGLLLVGLVIYLSLAPLSPSKVMEFPFSDKAGHFLAYFATMFWFGQLFTKKWASLAIALSLIAMGVILEFFQGATGYRSFEVSDMAANTAGVAVGLFLSWTKLGNLFFAFEALLRRSLPRS